LFLTVQEALNNIAKHSRASEARLAFILDDSTLEIDVEDNGAGFSATTAGGSRHGMSNIRERIKEIGGEAEISSQPGKGTRICLRIPIRMKKEA
jgi:two-component system NarL family sensor kinase